VQSIRETHPGDGPVPPAAAGGLPYVDEHAIAIPAARDVVWAALEDHARTSLRLPRGTPLALLLGTRPPEGFEVAGREPGELLTLAGRHRFSRYVLAFDLADAAGGTTRLRARTFAAFPGVHGRAYRALVVGTGGHAVATRHVLRSVRRRSVDLAATRAQPLTAPRGTRG
jgi:hypothetical protein